MRKRLGGALGALVLLVALAPVGARADHCKPLYVFSGVDTPAGFRGSNLGAVGCLYVGSDVDTNYLTPGATHLTVGTTATPDGTSTVTLDGVEIELVFTAPSSPGGRWNSQVIALEGAREVTATVPTATGVVLTVTYRAAA